MAPVSVGLGGGEAEAPNPEVALSLRDFNR